MKRKILLIDDDEADQFIFRRALQKIEANVEFSTADSGREGLETLKEADAENLVVFLDLNMPQMHGFECLKEIKASAQLKNIPVIIYSTSDNPADVKKAKELGAQMFVTKPFEFAGLKAKLSEIIETIFPEK